MKYIEKSLCYPFPVELTERILSPNRVIHLRERDLEMFSGKPGIMHEFQAESESNAEFIDKVFSCVMKNEFVMNALSELVCIEAPHDPPLLMGELERLQDFFEQRSGDTKWSMSNVYSPQPLTALIIAM